MPYKRRFARKRRVNRRKAPRYANKRGQLRSNFVETLDAGYLNSNTGTIISAAFNQIPQHQAYALLYRQFCITKLDVIVVPEYNTAEYNAAAYNSSIATGGSPAFGNVARITHAPVFSGDVITPSTEVVVLTNNRSRIRQLTQNKPIKMTCRPVPSLNQQDGNALIPSTVPVSKRGQWLSTDTADAILWKGIQCWISQQINGNYFVNMTVAKVFYKIHFALRDPK